MRKGNDPSADLKALPSCGTGDKPVPLYAASYGAELALNGRRGLSLPAPPLPENNIKRGIAPWIEVRT